MTTVSDQKIKRLIHQSNLIEGYDDPEFDAQGLVAWRHLEQVLYDQLDHGDIRKVQKIVTLKQTDMRPHWRGYYRDMSGQRVWIAGREGLTPKEIPSAMDKWLAGYRDLDSKRAHIEFEQIHPFVDGNGRTGRLLLWWMQMHREEPLSNITYAKRHDYYRWFK